MEIYVKSEKRSDFMFKKRLAFLMTFLIIFATLGGFVYAESETFKGNDEPVNEPVVVVGVSASKLKDKYGDLSDEEIQDILNSGAELIFNNINNTENKFELMRNENKYLDMFDIKIIDNLSNEKLLNNNGIVPSSLPTEPFSDYYPYIVRSTEGTGYYSVSASGTLHFGDPSIESASGKHRSGTWLGGDPNPRYTPGGSSMWVHLRVIIVGFGVNSNGDIYMK
jgi:hypothetical protein